MRANSCMGANYFSLSKFKNAYEYWLKALEIAEDMNYSQGIANHQHNIGNIFMSQKDYDKALHYYTLALNTSEKTGNNQLATNAYTSIGNVYAKMKDYAKALEYHFKALAIDEQLGQKGDIAADKINIGTVYNDLGKYTNALDILAEALQIKKDIGDKNGAAKAYNMTGKVYLYIAKQSKTGADKTQMLKNAVLYLDSAVATDKEIGYLDNLQLSYKYLSEAQEILQDHSAAFESYKGYITIKDSVYSLEKQAEIFNLEKQAEIETEKRQAERIEAEHERKEYIEIGGISLFIIVMILATLLIRHKRINPKVIDILGTFSVLIVFEFIELLLHGKIEALTHHNLTLTLLCLLGLAAIIIPVHHRIDHWMKDKIGSKQH